MTINVEKQQQKGGDGSCQSRSKGEGMHENQKRTQERIILKVFTDLKKTIYPKTLNWKKYEDDMTGRTFVAIKVDQEYLVARCYSKDL